MSGHITRMSRGSRSGRPGAARAAPRAARRPGGPHRGRSAPGASGPPRPGRAPRGRVGGEVGLEPPSSVSGAAPSWWWSTAPVDVRLRWSSRTSRPSVASSGWSTRRWLRSSRRGTGPVSPRSARHITSLVRQPHVDVVGLGQRREQLDLGDGHPRVAEQREPRGQVGHAGAQPAEGLGVPDVRRRRTDPATSACQSRGCQARSSSSVPPCPSVGRPSSQSTRSCGRCTAYDAKRAAMRRATAYLRPRRNSASSPVSKWPRCRASVRFHPRRGSRRSPRAGARRARPAPRVVLDGAGELGDQGPRRAGTPPRSAVERPAAVTAPAEPVREPLAATAPRRGPAPAPAPSRTGPPAGAPAGRRAGRRAGRCAGARWRWSVTGEP